MPKRSLKIRFPSSVKLIVADLHPRGSKHRQLPRSKWIRFTSNLVSLVFVFISNNQWNFFTYFFLVYSRMAWLGLFISSRKFAIDSIFYWPKVFQLISPTALSPEEEKTIRIFLMLARFAFTEGGNQTRLPAQQESAWSITQMPQLFIFTELRWWSSSKRDRHSTKGF